MTLFLDTKVDTVINSCRYFDLFLDDTVFNTFASACQTRMSYDCPLAVALTAELLDNEWALFYRLKSLTTTATAL